MNQKEFSDNIQLFEILLWENQRIKNKQAKQEVISEYCWILKKIFLKSFYRIVLAQMLSNCIVKCKKNTCTGDKRGESKHTVVDFNRY